MEDPDYHESDSILMFIYSIPYFVDFVIGIISTKWAILLIDKGEEKPEERELHEEEENELRRFS